MWTRQKEKEKTLQIIKVIEDRKYKTSEHPVPIVEHYFFQTHPHFQSCHEEHLEEPSRIPPQTLNLFDDYSAIYHLPDIERPISGHVEKNEIVWPMFQQPVLLYSYGRYTNVIELSKSRITMKKSHHMLEIAGYIRWRKTDS